VKENIDILHGVVTDAVVRQESGISGKDVWNENLQPQTAVRARTIPVLEAESERLREMLKQVGRHSIECIFSSPA
jgi:hypothetical protein